MNYSDDKEMSYERLVLSLTELICEIMNSEGISRDELARRIGRSKGYVTLFLDGRTKMTLRAISDIFYVLDRQLTFDS